MNYTTKTDNICFYNAVISINYFSKTVTIYILCIHRFLHICISGLTGLKHSIGRHLLNCSCDCDKENIRRATNMPLGFRLRVYVAYKHDGRLLVNNMETSISLRLYINQHFPGPMTLFASVKNVTFRV